jgi:hypothetical protein
MFNPFFRSYLPGFRVGPDDVPGFNIDDNGLPQRASASSAGTLPDSAAQPYPDTTQAQSPPSISFRLPGAEGWVLSAPLNGSPGFRVSPQDDVPGLNIRLGRGMRYRASTSTKTASSSRKQPGPMDCRRDP